MTEHVLKREVLALELAGRDIKWERPVRSVARAQLADLMEIMDLKIEDKTSPTGAEAAQCLRAANKVLEFLYKYSADLSVRRAHFDENATERELMEVAKSIQAFLVVPIRGSAGDTLPVEPEATAATEA